METRRLGKAGLHVSELALGTMTMGWRNDEPESHRILDVAFDSGITLIDTADIYSRWVEGNPGGVSEQFVGNWLKTKSRYDIVLATKVRGRMWDGPSGEGLSRMHIIKACEDSLRRLKVDHIDLYQCHYPDEDTPIEETVEAMGELVKQGKVRYLGLSNFPAWLHAKANAHAAMHGLPEFVSTQPKYNLICRRDVEKELAPFCLADEVGVIPYSPLEGGLLTGKYRPNEDGPAEARHTVNGRAQEKLTPQVIRTLETLAHIATQRGETMTQTALVWMLSKDFITSPIIGATSVEQLMDSLPAAGKRLSLEELETLDEVSNGL
ncbi:MAG: aldo/keto reductase [Calditrichaeota bacterium]|nr:aldo/keto reductase [Calditrichota bacterium]